MLSGRVQRFPKPLAMRHSLPSPLCIQAFEPSTPEELEELRQAAVQFLNGEQEEISFSSLRCGVLCACLCARLRPPLLRAFSLSSSFACAVASRSQVTEILQIVREVFQEKLTAARREIADAASAASSLSENVAGQAPATSDSPSHPSAAGASAASPPSAALKPKLNAASPRTNKAPSTLAPEATVPKSAFLACNKESPIAPLRGRRESRATQLRVVSPFRLCFRSWRRRPCQRRAFAGRGS